MSTDPAAPLDDFAPAHDFFVGVDSDGCAFDTMEIKHKECFIPAIIRCWDLQPVSKFAREVAEFVNLYSKWRGTNRFPALLMVFDLLAERPEVAARNASLPNVQPLRDWVARETRLAGPALRAEVERTGNPVLARALDWNNAVNAAIGETVKGVPPFPFVRESLAKVATQADVICVSATPGEALAREWAEHDIAKFCRVIAGQEMGTKKEHLAFAAGGRYAKSHVLMVGDALGDLAAARANGALFYPINPGTEDASWRRFHDEAFARFVSRTYAGDYESRLIRDFENLLPDTPPWKR
ncbi:MAG: HAD family hydrolase [Phycisphaerae bacterium]|nr:HAD family hydrolase [Phycisphaerae bacterium]